MCDEFNTPANGASLGSLLWQTGFLALGPGPTSSTSSISSTSSLLKQRKVISGWLKKICFRASVRACVLGYNLL